MFFLCPNFKLGRGIIGTNVRTKFNENRTRNVASLVFTRFLFSQIWKPAPPTGGHVFQRTGITFQLYQHIIKPNILTKLHEYWACYVTSRVFTRINLLTKFHDDRTRNAASRVITTKCRRTDGRETKTDPKSLPEQSGELKTV
ncbi:hypothetical protein DPMN_115064 [Dreissena polymorpha]|uniref:Uncharacterized protein n=1 Tax=Dreissena polymorpha TaxID=45954 RepID=A0A9D4KLD2_DREPO|nr:hypothetical protein DPMN_115064 [Dreissena polymorpha]